MPIIIWVRGVSNSGKTRSIRRFLENRGVFFPDSPNDVKVVLPIQKNGQTYKVGVTSAGDTAQHVIDNFTFLRPHNCDVIVCASKSKRESYEEVQNQAGTGANLVPIQTRKLHGAEATPAAIQAEINLVAGEIERNIP